MRHDEEQGQGGERRRFPLQIDEQNYTVDMPVITGQGILDLAQKSADTHFVTQIIVGADDIVVAPGDDVDLSEPGRERFTIVAKPDKACNITVNTRQKPWEARTITFEQVVALAFDTSGDDPNTTAYTVNFRCGDQSDPDGPMVAGSSVKVRCGMIFDVDRTDRS